MARRREYATVLAHDRAILTAAENRTVTIATAEQIRAFPGKGIQGTVNGARIAAGNAALMQELNVAIPENTATQPGTTSMYIARNGQLLGVVEARDTLRATAASAIARLRRLGIRTAMLTGDTASTADAIARAAGIDQVWAGLLPDQKLAKIRELQQQGHRVAMAGDGINDAAAISQADAGLARPVHCTADVISQRERRGRQRIVARRPAAGSWRNLPLPHEMTVIGLPDLWSDRPCPREPFRRPGRHIDSRNSRTRVVQPCNSHDINLIRTQLSGAKFAKTRVAIRSRRLIRLARPNLLISHWRGFGRRCRRRRAESLAGLS